MSEKLQKAILATGSIALFAVSAISIRNTSLTMDELAHLPAGYSYIKKLDMRLNPEHPPLVKDLAALPLLFINNIEFPSHIRAWTQDVNGQWDFGNRFLFHMENPAPAMIFWARIPMIAVLTAGGYFVWLFGKRFFSPKTGVLAFLFYCLSPTLIAHGRLVTTDVGITVAGLAATYFFFRFLEKPSPNNTFVAGFFLGLTQLVKFTGVFLFPYFAFLALSWLVLKKRPFKEYIPKFGLLLLITAGLVYIVYIPHVWNYPQQRQIRDIKFILRSHPAQWIGPLLSKAASLSPLRPLVQYLYGLAMVFQRGVGGNTTYFLGKVSGRGWKTYFPLLYLLKIPLSFHILTVMSALAVSFQVRKPFWVKPVKRMSNCLRQNFTEFGLLVFVLLYWGITISGNLNIGIRHLLPIFPFVFLLVARGLDFGLRPPLPSAAWFLIAALLVFQAGSVFSHFPHFIPYYNRLAGGPQKGHLYAVDSNLDWGQDLKRLARWVKKTGIQNIYVDYFGGADVEYYLGDKARYFWCSRKEKEVKKPAYLAVSATKLQAGRAMPAPGFTQPTDCYRWLNKEKLVKRIGYSIFVYQIH